jgi:hypothetical protein
MHDKSILPHHAGDLTCHPISSRTSSRSLACSWPIPFSLLYDFLLAFQILTLSLSQKKKTIHTFVEIKYKLIYHFFTSFLLA